MQVYFFQVFILYRHRLPFLQMSTRFLRMQSLASCCSSSSCWPYSYSHCFATGSPSGQGFPLSCSTYSSSSTPSRKSCSPTASTANIASQATHFKHYPLPFNQCSIFSGHALFIIREMMGVLFSFVLEVVIIKILSSKSCATSDLYPTDTDPESCIT